MRRTCRNSVVAELEKRDRFQSEEAGRAGFGGDGKCLGNRRDKANKTASLSD